MTTASFGQLLESRSGSLNATWQHRINTLEILDYVPTETIQVKTPLYIKSIIREGSTLRLVFGDNPSEFHTSEYDVVKTGNNYFIYPAGSKALMAKIPDAPFVFEATEPPVVHTGSASVISEGGGARITGYLTTLGSGDTAEVFFEWGLTPAYGNVTPPQQLNAPGEFSAEITGLTPGKTYFIRAKAVGEGISIGPDSSLIAVPSASDAGSGKTLSRFWLLLVIASGAAVVVAAIKIRATASAGGD
jgi:hypothetical protein